ncbi:VIT1/CCC1 transporter family protein [Candidatus Bathyarchaeota archaeon]|nr:VIT1/CCC1 transporter family protein [Candidatus Bathyarchaeota archaeon]
MLKERIKEFKKLLKFFEAEEIYRRYFFMNMFDGALTTLGIIMGAYFSGAYLKAIIGAAFGAGIAMGLSGFSGAYITEKAEKLKKLNELKKAMLTDLNNSIHEKSVELTAFVAAIIDGLSPVLAVTLSVTPFLLTLVNLISVHEAFYFSLIIITGLLFAMGAFLGKISKESFILSGVKMMLIGAAAAILIMLLI